MNLNEMIEREIANGYGDANAQSKVCQDIVLKAIANSSLSRNMTSWMRPAPFFIWEK